MPRKGGSAKRERHDVHIERSLPDLGKPRARQGGLAGRSTMNTARLEAARAP